MLFFADQVLMTSLSVRYPTGHLNNIPVVPTEPLIKVLEAACAKKSLDPKLHKLVWVIEIVFCLDELFFR